MTSRRDPATESSAWSSPQAGAFVDDRYELCRLVGEGSHGWVFLAKHVRLGRQFALKLLKENTARDPEWQLRFLQEAKAASLIGHENIVAVTDFGQCDTLGFYFVMEFIDGPSLHDLLQQEGYLSISRATEIISQLANALQQVHKLGIVHCDLTPGNIIIAKANTTAEVPKILDFGVSTAVAMTVTDETLFGTPRYMAPEQLDGANIDHRSDQFALACVFHEMITGDSPWECTEWSEAERVIPHTPPRNISEGPQPVNADLAEVLAKALSMHRGERYRSVIEFAREIRRSTGTRLTPRFDPIETVEDSEEKALVRAKVQIATNLTEPSLVIGISESETQLRRIDVTFQTRSRFRREFERNLSTGGLFVPTDVAFDLNERVALELHYPEEEASVELGGTVVCAFRENHGGFGINIDTSEIPVLETFLEECAIEDRLPGELIVEPCYDDLSLETLRSAEAFVLTRIGEPQSVAQVRQLCSGLPIDVDETLLVLRSRGIVCFREDDRWTDWSFASAEGTSSAASSDPKMPENGSALDSATADAPPGFDADDEHVTLSMITLYENEGNFLKAIDVCRKALIAFPQSGTLHHRFAILLARFSDNIPEAINAIEKAAALAPQDPAILQGRNYIYAMNATLGPSD
jgi:serine/threonine protein kinase